VKDDSQDRKWTHNLKCSSEYLISVAFNSDKHICDDRDDRMLTIEHEEFKGNVVDYENGDSSRCLWLPSPDVEKDNPRAHQILLPPQTLVRALNLSYVQKEGVFVDEDGAIAIICDGECENYFEDSICNLILLRADLFERLLGLGDVRYFAFSERFSPNRGYGNKSDRHWELDASGELRASCLNESKPRKDVVPGFCDGCYFSEPRLFDLEVDALNAFSQFTFDYL